MDFLKELTSWLDRLKRPPFAIAAAVILGIVLLSDFLLDSFGLSDFRMVVGIAFILAVIALTATFVNLLWEQGCQLYRSRVRMNFRRKRLHQLTDDEKAIMNRYIDGRTRTQYFDGSNGVVIGLEVAGLISRMSDIGFGWSGFPYNITDFAWDYLNKHPELVAGSRLGEVVGGDE